MSDTAFQIQYRDEFILGFENRQSDLRTTTVTEANVKGNIATFLVADSGGANAVTRGVNGLIPYRADNNNQYQCTLAEWHDGVRKTNFNVLSSQGDQNRIMQETTMGTLNRKIDQDILAALANTTVNTGSSVKATLDLVVRAKVILGNNNVPTQEMDNMFAVVTPAFMGYLNQIPEFASSDYVDIKPFGGQTRKYLRWFGINWIENTEITGLGTATEQCYMYHRHSIGHAVHKEGIQTVVGYNDEHDYSYCRATADMGSKLLQTNGVVQMNHDGSAYVAA